MRYLYAEPNHCVCIFVGTAGELPGLPRHPRPAGLPQADNVAPDYKTQASALLYGDPYDWDNLNDSPTASRIICGTYY